MTTDTSRAGDNLSESAKQRSQLFTSLVEKDGLGVLPGRYGGDYNNDMLAMSNGNHGAPILVLGLKVTGADGGVQLDMSSMGPLRQLSKEWLKTVTFGLRQSDTAAGAFADSIERAMAANTLVTGLLILDRVTQKVNMLRVEWNES